MSETKTPTLPPLLTDEQIIELWNAEVRRSPWDADKIQFARNVEQAVREALAQPAPAGDERAAFEAWAKDKGYRCAWLPAEDGVCAGYDAAATHHAFKGWQARASHPTAQAAVAVPESRNDGMPQSTSERYLRRLLAARVGIHGAYYDDGEAQGSELGVSIDFMREPVVDIDAKLRELTLRRAAAPQPTKEGE